MQVHCLQRGYLFKTCRDPANNTYKMWFQSFEEFKKVRKEILNIKWQQGQGTTYYRLDKDDLPETMLLLSALITPYCRDKRTNLECEDLRTHAALLTVPERIA